MTDVALIHRTSIFLDVLRRCKILKTSWHQVIRPFVPYTQYTLITWKNLKELLAPYVRNVFMGASDLPQLKGRLFLVIDEEKNNKNLFMCYYDRISNLVQLTGEHWNFVRSPYDIWIQEIDDNVVFI